MEWFARDFDHRLYFRIYRNKEEEALREGPALAALLGLPPNSLLLDLPCGWGRLRPHLESLGLQVFGGDLSRLNLLRQAQEFPGPMARLDLRALPFRDQCADGVLCAFTSWGYFRTEDENLRQLTEFRRVLRPGGVLLLDLVGRGFLERAVAKVEGRWLDVEEEGYRERVHWGPGRERIYTDRLCQGVRFRHDIWIPSDAQVQALAGAAGLTLDQRWGGLQNEPWSADSERWIYRFIRGCLRR